MKTGKFIQSQYEREIARIISEVEIAEAAILEEREILDIQSKLRIQASHQDGGMRVSLDTSGGVLVQFDKKNTWLTLLYVHVNPVKPQRQMLEDLSSLHLRDLRTIHPKRTGEILRMLAKKHMLQQEEEATKKWWKFW